MMHSALRTLLVASLYGAGALGASAATLTPTAGKVLINQGSGFKAIDAAIELNAGDRIMVQPGGAATLAYADGCQTLLSTASVVAVKPASPCAVKAARPDGAMFAGADDSEALFVEGPPPQAFVTIGATVAGVTGTVARIVSRQNDRPISP